MKVKKGLSEEKVIAAAVELFARQGYYKTTTAHVAQQLGVTQPYVFHFFQTKQQLFLAVLEHGTQKIYETFSATPLPEGKDVQSLLWAMGAAFGQLMKTNRDEMLLVMNAHVIDEEPVRAKSREWHARIFQLVLGNLDRIGTPNARQEAADFIGRGLFIAMTSQLGLEELCPY